MVDLKKQYERVKVDIDKAVLDCIGSTKFINGPEVQTFKKNLEKYLNVKHVIPCANGTDALQIALMALGLKPGDEVIVPSFTYVATAEVIALLNLTPIMVDVDPESFNITAQIIEEAITPKVKAIVPVHLYGQNANMEEILAVARKHNLFVIEDGAQSIGADYYFSNGRVSKSGTLGDIGCTSFFPSKNLGCYGDGGAIFTNNDELAAQIKMIANHGQRKKYHHSVIGCNSRLDSLQAAILNIKLKHLDRYSESRKSVAQFYDNAFNQCGDLVTPKRMKHSNHVFHQYTMKVKGGKRDALKQYLADHQVPSMIYYPIPLYDQDAFKNFYLGEPHHNTEALCQEVLSLPIHTEMTTVELTYICKTVLEFFQK